MPLGFAVMLWAAEVLPPSRPVPAPALALSAAELARTSRVLARPAAEPRPPRRARPLTRPDQQQREGPADLAVLFGNRRAGGQVEMGALGGGRADAPGLLHIGVGLDF